MQDIKETFKDEASFELIYWPSYVLRSIASAILSPTLDHNHYLSDDPAEEQSKIEYRKFLEKIWKHFREAKAIDVVLAGNFSYFHQREFGAALKETGTPFIIIHKENVRPPKRIKEYWSHLYKMRRGPFSGRKILVYNNMERELEISSGVAKPRGVIVTGMPRLDRMHRSRREHAGEMFMSTRPQVLFFAFSRDDKLTAPGRKVSVGAGKGHYQIDGEWGSLNWDGVWAETNRAIVQIARDHPEYRVIIKVKEPFRKRKQSALPEFLFTDGEDLPSNLKIVFGGDPFDLITASNIIIGFNTTALLEAIAAGKPVIVPRFMETADPARRDLIIDLGDAVDYAHSPMELVELICRYAKQPAKVSLNLPSKSSRILRHWVGNDDGAAGRRVLEAVNNEIQTDRRM